MMQTAIDEYALALRRGLKESRECSAAGKRSHPLVLDEILPENYPGVVQDLGLMENLTMMQMAIFSIRPKSCTTPG